MTRDYKLTPRERQRFLRFLDRLTLVIVLGAIAYIACSYLIGLRCAEG